MRLKFEGAAGEPGELTQTAVGGAEDVQVQQLPGDAEAAPVPDISCKESCALRSPISASFLSPFTL